MDSATWRKTRRHPQGMFGGLSEAGVLRRKAAKRRLRLFACGCCRLVWEHLPGDRVRAVVELAERFADGEATEPQMAAAARKIARLAEGPFVPGEPRWRETTLAAMAEATAQPKAVVAAFLPISVPMPFAGHLGGAREGEAVLCDLFRCVFGDPFRPVKLDRRWRTANVTDLARTVYEERAFDRLPILADALMDAGCDDEEILGHCRSEGPHVRGCWVVDLVLGKA